MSRQQLRRRCAWGTPYKGSRKRRLHNHY
jgi:hypothetical protein